MIISEVKKIVSLSGACEDLCNVILCIGFIKPFYDSNRWGIFQRNPSVNVVKIHWTEELLKEKE